MALEKETASGPISRPVPRLSTPVDQPQLRE